MSTDMFSNEYSQARNNQYREWFLKEEWPRRVALKASIGRLTNAQVTSWLTNNYTRDSYLKSLTGSDPIEIHYYQREAEKRNLAY